MAPETSESVQGDAAHYGRPADVFSLAVTAVSMLNKREPPGLRILVRDGRAKDLGDLNRGHPAYKVVVACIADCPEARPTASKLRGDLLKIQKEYFQAAAIKSGDSGDTFSGCVSTHDMVIANLRDELASAIASRDIAFAGLNAAIAERDAALAECKRISQDRDNALAEIGRMSLSHSAERENTVAKLAAANQEISRLRTLSAECKEAGPTEGTASPTLTLSAGQDSQRSAQPSPQPTSSDGGFLGTWRSLLDDVSAWVIAGKLCLLDIIEIVVVSTQCEHSIAFFFAI